MKLFCFLILALVILTNCTSRMPPGPVYLAYPENRPIEIELRNFSFNPNHIAVFQNDSPLTFRLTNTADIFVAVPFSSVSKNGANIFIYNAPEDAYRFHGMAPYWSEGFYLYSKHEEPMASYKASKLIGAMARTSKGEDLGRIDDLVISADGQVGDLIVSHMGKRVAVPFRVLSRSGEDAFVLNTTVKALEAAPAF